MKLVRISSHTYTVHNFPCSKRAVWPVKAEMNRHFRENEYGSLLLYLLASNHLSIKVIIKPISIAEKIISHRKLELSQYLPALEADV